MPADLEEEHHVAVIACGKDGVPMRQLLCVGDGEGLAPAAFVTAGDPDIDVGGAFFSSAEPCGEHRAVAERQHGRSVAVRSGERIADEFFDILHFQPHSSYSDGSASASFGAFIGTRLSGS